MYLRTCLNTKLFHSPHTDQILDVFSQQHNYYDVAIQNKLAKCIIHRTVMIGLISFTITNSSCHNVF